MTTTRSPDEMISDGNRFSPTRAKQLVCFSSLSLTRPTLIFHGDSVASAGQRIDFFYSNKSTKQSNGIDLHVSSTEESQSLQRMTSRCFSHDATYLPSGCQATDVTIVLSNRKRTFRFFSSTSYLCRLSRTFSHSPVDVFQTISEPS